MKKLFLLVAAASMLSLSGVAKANDLTNNDDTPFAVKNSTDCDRFNANSDFIPTRCQTGTGSQGGSDSADGSTGSPS